MARTATETLSMISEAGGAAIWAQLHDPNDLENAITLHNDGLVELFRDDAGCGLGVRLTAAGLARVADPAGAVPTLAQLKQRSLVELPAAVEGIPLEAMNAMVSKLDGEITGLARLAGYLAYRCGYGQGDQGHDKAVAYSNALARKVRRALGYHTTPDIRF